MNTLVGKKIRTLRKQKGLSQEQVADRLHISQSTYARIESGDSHSWASYIEPISNLFNIQPEELLKQESIIVNQNQQGGNGAFIINQLSEKLIEQYEQRIKDKDEIIDLLKIQLQNLK
jgi:transcriptional regulator with XRE-family HTH domain